MTRAYDPELMKYVVQWCAQQEVRLRSRLAPLESGQTRLRCRVPGGEWEDVTEQEIEKLKLRIKEIEALLARCSEQNPAPGTEMSAA